MNMTFEDNVTDLEAKIIKKEVRALDCPFLKVSSKAIKGYTDRTIIIKVNAFSIEGKLEGARALEQYKAILHNRRIEKFNK